MKCDKCKNEIVETWVRGKTYLGIDEHHNPPKFMVDEWKGKTHNLCRKCHRNLHDEIIKILNKENLKFIKSEHWAWIKIIPNKRKEIVKRIIKFTK